MSDGAIDPRSFGASFQTFMERMTAQAPTEEPELLRKAAPAAADEGAGRTVEDRHVGGGRLTRTPLGFGSSPAEGGAG